MRNIVKIVLALALSIAPALAATSPAHAQQNNCPMNSVCIYDLPNYQGRMVAVPIKPRRLTCYNLISYAEGSLRNHARSAINNNGYGMTAHFGHMQGCGFARWTNIRAGMGVPNSGNLRINSVYFP